MNTHMTTKEIATEIRAELKPERNTKMNNNTGTLTYNSYSQKYTLTYKITDYLSPTIITFGRLNYANPLKSALRAISDLHEVYPQIKISINI